MAKNITKLITVELDLIIWDECHHSYTSKCQESLRYFSDTIKIGFSATPDYLYSKKKAGFEEVQIGEKLMYLDPEKSAERYFCHLIDKIDLREAIMRRMLSPIATAVIRVDINLDGIKVINTLQGEDYNSRELNPVLRHNWPIMEEAILNCLKQGIGDEDGEKKLIDQEQIFIVCSLVEHAETLAKTLQREGYKAECVVGATKDIIRQDILDRFRQKEIRIITSVNVLKEGWDAPEATVCFMVRPTLSRLLYQQVIGRVLRRDPQNSGKVALVVDFLGKYSRMTPLTTPTFFGLTKFYQGEMIIPPGRIENEPRNYPGIYNPFLIGQQLVEIQVFDQKVERICPGVIRIDGQVFLTRGKICQDLGIEADLWTEIVQVGIIIPSEFSGHNYYPLERVIKVAEKKFKILILGREKEILSQEELTQIFKLKTTYLKKFSPYRIEDVGEMVGSGKYAEIKLRKIDKFLMGQIISQIKTDFENTLKNYLYLKEELEVEDEEEFEDEFEFEYEEDEEEHEKSRWRMKRSLRMNSYFEYEEDEEDDINTERRKMIEQFLKTKKEDLIKNLLKLADGYYTKCPICRSAWLKDNYTNEAFCIECNIPKKYRKTGEISQLEIGGKKLVSVNIGIHIVQRKEFQAVVRKIHPEFGIEKEINFDKIKKIDF